MKLRVQLVNNYQSLTITTKTDIPGVKGHVDPLLDLIVIKKPHLISNLHLADSLKVSFTKLAWAVFRNPIYELWLQKLKEFSLFKNTHREKAS